MATGNAAAQRAQPDCCLCIYGPRPIFFLNQGDEMPASTILIGEFRFLTASPVLTVPQNSNTRIQTRLRTLLVLRLRAM